MTNHKPFPIPTKYLYNLSDIFPLFFFSTVYLSSMDAPPFNNGINHLSEFQHYQNYWGKPRKSAVKTSSEVVRLNNSELETGNSVGNPKKKFLACKHSAQMGKSFLGPKGGNNYAHQVFDERIPREKTEKKSSILAKFSKKNILAKKNTTTSKEENKKCVIDVANERKKLLNLFRKECDSLRKQRGKLFKRIDRMAYKVIQDSGEMFMTHKIFGPIPGVEIEDCFNYRAELIIMGLHFHHIRGIDYKTMSNNRVLATSIVATEGYGDTMKNQDELIYTGEGGGGTIDGNGNSKGYKDQKLKGGNLALKNSLEAGNFVRVIRGMKSKQNVNSTTKFVYDGLYKVTGFGKKIGSNGKLQFEFTLKRCSGQRTIVWAKYK